VRSEHAACTNPNPALADDLEQDFDGPDVADLDQLMRMLQQEQEDVLLS
jgi:hypothetical protein